MCINYRMEGRIQDQRLVRSYKEFLKFGDNRFVNEMPELIEDSRDIYVLCGSLVEHYKKQRVTFHFHFFAESSGDGANRDFCIRIAGSESLLNAMSAFSADELSSRNGNCGNSQQYPPMLVDVAEEVYDSKGATFRPLPAVIGLQSLDLCRRFWGNPFEPLPPKLVFERFDCVADRKHILVTGFIVRSKDEFPHQIVKGRPQVLESVSDDKRNGNGNGGSNCESEDNTASARLYLGHHIARFFFKIPLLLSFKRLKVFCGPDDFLLNRI